MTDLSILRSGILLRQDRYRVVRIIGHGGMGAVYEVIDETLHSRLALKQFMRTEPALRLAFEREASLLANLRHTALPRVVDRFPEADSEFLVMDYIEGDTLLDLVNHTGALAHALVQNYAEQLFDVLDYLHTRMPIVIHRDIKPENIKISAAGQLYLLDFGIAKGSAGVYITTSADKSVPALSAGYAPIEQFLNVETGPQSDLFSAAATLYHALTGQRPVPANERQQAVSNNHPDPLVTPQQLNSGLPPVLCQMLTQALSLRAADRPESAAAMRMQLMAAGRSTAQPSGPAPTELGETIGPAPSAAVQAQNVRAVPSIVPEPDALPLPIRSPAGRAGQHSLQKRLVQLVRQVLDSYEGAWMVWCDPHGEWQPLIQRVAEDGRMGGFQLLTITDMIAGELGGLRARQEIQQLLDSNTSFVLLVRSAHQQLGWLWGQALLAERQYTTRLRDQLITWGWRPQRPDLPDDAIVRLAIQGLQQNPAEWGGSGLQPDMPLLLEVLAGGARPDSDQEYILQLTLELAGLPPYDAHDEERWRIRSLARLLFTEAHGLVPRLLSDQHEYLIAADLRPFAQRILQAGLKICA